MIINIGCDILYIHRIYKLLRYDNFLSKFFTLNEIDMFNKDKLNNKNYVKRIASNLCVKESFFKCISDRIDVFKFCDLEVLRHSSGKPYINLYGELSKFNAEYNIHVTLSNERDIVTSFVLLEKII